MNNRRIGIMASLAGLFASVSIAGAKVFAPLKTPIRLSHHSYGHPHNGGSRLADLRVVQNRRRMAKKSRAVNRKVARGWRP